MLIVPGLENGVDGALSLNLGGHCGNDKSNDMRGVDSGHYWLRFRRGFLFCL